jgi:glycosyltransferase involved in cell wall biosynthesis
MKLNIFLTVHQFLPEYFSGTEILTLGVAKELVRRGHRVSVLTGFPGRNDLPELARFDEYEIDGIDVYRFHHAFVPMAGQRVLSEIEYNNRMAARYFAQLLQRIKPDIVHFFHFSRLGTSLVDVAAAAGVPAYYTPTDFWSVCRTAQLMLTDGRVCGGPSRYGGNCVKHIASLANGTRGERIAKFVPDIMADAVVKLTISGVLPNYEHCQDVAAVGQRKSFNVARLNALHGIVAPTRMMSEKLIANGVDGRLISQSGYGIDIAGYRNRTRKIGESDAITFGFIGTLQRHKGCHVLVDAFTQLGSGRAKLRIYGNTTDAPDYIDSLQRMAACVNSIELCGTFPNGEIAEVLDGLDVLVVPSIWFENSPLVIHSALAAKCPVIASDFPGMSEVVRHGWNGLTFRPGDVQSLYEQLIRLVNDPTLIESLSANCAQPKSVREYVDELLSLYANHHLAVAGRGEIAGRQTIKPLENYALSGYVSGWSIVDFDAPLSVSILKDGILLGQTDEFIPRPDVRDELRKHWNHIKTEHVGFIVTFPLDTIRAKAVLQIEAKDGRVIELPLNGFTRGNAVHISGGDFFAIDEERFEKADKATAVG